MVVGACVAAAGARQCGGWSVCGRCWSETMWWLERVWPLLERDNVVVGACVAVPCWRETMWWLERVWPYLAGGRQCGGWSVCGSTLLEGDNAVVGACVAAAGARQCGGWSACGRCWRETMWWLERVWPYLAGGRQCGGWSVCGSTLLEGDNAVVGACVAVPLGGTAAQCACGSRGTRQSSHTASGRPSHHHASRWGTASTSTQHTHIQMKTKAKCT